MRRRRATPTQAALFEEGYPWTETDQLQYQIWGGLATWGVFQLHGWDARAFRIDGDAVKYWCNQVVNVELVHEVPGVLPKQGFRSVVAGGIVLRALGAAQPFPAGLKWDAADCSVDTALHVALARIRSEEG